MDTHEIASGALKLILACALGGMVGWQREAQDRPAGFRTHILVCVGACLLMILSLATAKVMVAPGHPYGAGDPGRIAAQVVSGIGFLGAGTILRQGSMVRGLTTAASLWAVAAIGLATGLGGNLGAIAVIATFLVLATLTVFSRLEAHLTGRWHGRDLVILLPRDAVVSAIRILVDRGLGIRGVESAASGTEDLQRVRLTLLIPPQVQVEQITNDLLTLPGIREIHWE